MDKLIVAAAVVTKQPVSKSDESAFIADLKAHCAKKLSAFKMPTTIFISNSLPKTSTGKIQRRHVATHFLEPKSKL